jgi:hypothetical protein
LQARSSTSVFLNRSSVEHSKSAAFHGGFLYLNPYLILCTSNLDDFDCVPPSLVSLPSASLRASRPDVHPRRRRTGQMALSKRFPRDIAELHVPSLGFTQLSREGLTGPAVRPGQAAGAVRVGSATLLRNSPNEEGCIRKADMVSDEAALDDGLSDIIFFTQRIPRRASLRRIALDASSSAGRRKDCVFRDHRRRSYATFLDKRTRQAVGFCPAAIARPYWPWNLSQCIPPDKLGARTTA